jgi:hypothetical protein
MGPIGVRWLDSPWWAESPRWRPAPARLMGPAGGYRPAPLDLIEERDTEVMSTDERRVSLRRFLHRLTASEAELEAQELQRESAECGSVPAGLCRRGQKVSISGRLRTVVYTPRTNLPTLEADLYDGSDIVTLVWLGRRHIAGIEPGRQLTARGRVAMRDDRKVIYNPYYELETSR